MRKLWLLAGADHLHENGLANKLSETDAVVAEASGSVQRPVSRIGWSDPLAMPIYSSGQTIWQIDPSRNILGNDDLILCADG